jgi:protein gp37
MSEKTLISWADKTFNPWIGCARVSPGCRFCYAERGQVRWGHTGLWRKSGPRRMLSEQYWRQPVKWNREAQAAGVQARVFCASLADVFDAHPDLAEPRARLWALIKDTPWLIWMLLTKRPENVAGMVPLSWHSGGWPANVWLGCSAEDQTRLDGRKSLLCEHPATVRFLSCEPLLAPLDLGLNPGGLWVPPDGQGFVPGEVAPAPPGVDWVIAGGESGPRARPTEAWWLVSLQAQCAEAGVPFHLKQAGQPLARIWGCQSLTGADPAEWPEPFPQDFPVTAMPA